MCCVVMMSLTYLLAQVLAWMDACLAGEPKLQLPLPLAGMRWQLRQASLYVLHIIAGVCAWRAAPLPP